MPKLPQILAVPEKAALYGSSRLGSRKERVCMTCTTATLPAELQGVSYVIRGDEKSYELSNHLGNVLSVISDRREAGSCTDSLVDFYYADGRSVSDYYPFGMAMDSRTQSGGGYRWGFNGMEKYDDWQGEGNAYDFGARVYDSRLGRWMSVDPLAQKFPFSAQYSSFGNNPIIFVDPDGRDLYIAGKIEVALLDIQSLVPEEYRSLIRVNSDGKILFDINDLPDNIKNFEGVSLLIDLTKPGYNYKYTVGDALLGIDRETNVLYENRVANANPNNKVLSAQGAIFNFSITERTDLSSNAIENSLPEEGFHGSVLIQDGDFSRPNVFSGSGEFPIKRNTIVFHELKENFYRTAKGKDYGGPNGAHQLSSDSGNKFSIEVNGEKDVNAGTAKGFKKRVE